MYDDSDFYMVVFNPEKNTFESICFASTRGWTYPCYGSCVDAPPELMEKYKEHLAAEAKAKERTYFEQRKRRLEEACAAAEITPEQYRKLWAALNDEDFRAIIKLLSTNLRSDFRKSLASQVREWLADPNPKYRSPLSPKQLQYV
jgi:hypothetical protein